MKSRKKQVNLRERFISLFTKISLTLFLIVIFFLLALSIKQNTETITGKFMTIQAEARITINIEGIRIKFVYPTTLENTHDQNWISANTTAEDNFFGVKNISIYLYDSGFNLINYTNSSTSPLFINFTGLSYGTYHLNATAYNNANFSNNTETRKIILKSISPEPFRRISGGSTRFKVYYPEEVKDEPPRDLTKELPAEIELPTKIEAPGEETEFFFPELQKKLIYFEEKTEFPGLIFGIISIMILILVISVMLLKKKKKVKKKKKK
jgi:phosphate starvation-inducible membrane PsiE